MSFLWAWEKWRRASFPLCRVWTASASSSRRCVGAASHSRTRTAHASRCLSAPLHPTVCTRSSPPLICVVVVVCVQHMLPLYLTLPSSAGTLQPVEGGLVKEMEPEVVSWRVHLSLPSLVQLTRTPRTQHTQLHKYVSHLTWTLPWRCSCNSSTTTASRCSLCLSASPWARLQLAQVSR